MTKNKTITRFLSIVLAVVLVLPTLLVMPVGAADIHPYAPTSTQVVNALNYLHGLQDNDGSIGDFATSAWAVMAIAAAGEDPSNWKLGTNPSVVDYLASNAASATTVNDYSRMVLAITAANENPASFGGKDFLSLLVSGYNGAQIGDNTLLNDDFWGIMALVSTGASFASTAIQGSVSFILDHQGADGGWSWGVDQASDTDDTAAAIQALIAAGQSAGSQAITSGLAYLKTQIGDSGGFLSWGSTNSATDSWAISSVIAAGQDPASTEWKSGTGKGPLDDLLSFQNADGSFNWTNATPSNKAGMTASAIPALLGYPYPVVTRAPQPESGVTVSVRIEGQNATIWSGTVTVDESIITDDQGGQHPLDQPTVLGALDKASQTGDFPYVVKNSSYGLYIYSVDGENPAGTAGWNYRVDYSSPMVGAADFILGETTPPDPPHQEILLAYAKYGEAPLKLTVDKTNPATDEVFTATVKQFDDNTGDWTNVSGATVHADADYTTDADGKVEISVGSDTSLNVYAEKGGCIRSNRVAVTVGAGSTQTNSNATAKLTANIIPAISFSISASSINFGDLGPGDASLPAKIVVTNQGAWKLDITAKVTDSAQDLYVDGLLLNSVKWNTFSTSVDKNGNSDCYAVLTVPEDYVSTGNQQGTLVFWASDGR